MYRVLVPALSLLLATGCSLGSGSSMLSFDSGSSAPPKASLASFGGTSDDQASAGASTSSKSKGLARVASAQEIRPKEKDSAPRGSFERAPPGALADRDYSGTRLNAEQARDLINTYRRSKGLRPLKLNSELTSAAKEHSKDLAKWDRISHFGSDGSNPWDRVKRTGYGARMAAENVGTGQASIDEVMKGWKASPGHNKNLLLPEAEHMGIALVQDPRTEFKTFWTLVLGTPQ